MSADPEASDESGDNPINPDEYTLRIGLGGQARKGRCQAGRAVHFGGPELDSVAAAKLTGTRERRSRQHCPAASDLLNSPAGQR